METSSRYLTIGDIADRLKVSRRRLDYALVTYHIAPAFRAGITRLWSEDDLPRIQSALARIASNRGGQL